LECQRIAAAVDRVGRLLIHRISPSIVCRTASSLSIFTIARPIVAGSVLLDYIVQNKHEQRASDRCFDCFCCSAPSPFDAIDNGTGTEHKAVARRRGGAP
jgi:hypothetical protein